MKNMICSACVMIMMSLTLSDGYCMYQERLAQALKDTRMEIQALERELADAEKEIGTDNTPTARAARAVNAAENSVKKAEAADEKKEKRAEEADRTKTSRYPSEPYYSWEYWHGRWQTGALYSEETRRARGWRTLAKKEAEKAKNAATEEEKMVAAQRAERAAENAEDEARKAEANAKSLADVKAEREAEDRKWMEMQRDRYSVVAGEATFASVSKIGICDGSNVTTPRAKNLEAKLEAAKKRLAQLEEYMEIWPV